ncbi:copper amine oxidase N-terminal domain-containing protein [Paenibacillus sp. TRM 82003]|nr:copper amine oxidase N-terminal domain-containing protein [Paenibacillus sp. TRM 82003]
MKIRNIALCMLALSLLGGAAAGAEEALQTWKGKKVRVTVNGSELEGGAIQIDGRTYLPLSSISNKLQASLNVDASGETVHINKPNVHLLLLTGDKNKPYFGKVYQGNHEFYVFAQVDNLKTKVHSIKTAVVDPKGQTVDSQVYKLTEEIKDELLWYSTNPFKIDFKSTGEYTVKFYIKQTEDRDYELVSEKAILSMKRE